MGRGIFSGAIWGTVVATVGLGTVSLVSEQPPGREPPKAPNTAPSQVQTSEPSETGATGDVSLNTGETPQSPTTAIVAAPADRGADPVADTQSAAVPQTGGVDDAPTAPTVEQGADIAVTTDTPDLPVVQSTEPVAPDEERELSISTEPAQPIAPEIDETATITDPEPELETVPATPVDDAASTPLAPAVTVEAPAAPEIDETVQPITEAINDVIATNDTAPVVETPVESAVLAEPETETSEVDATSPDTPIETVETVDDAPIEEEPLVVILDEPEPLPEVEPAEPVDVTPNAEVDAPAAPRKIGENAPQPGFGNSVGRLTDRKGPVAEAAETAGEAAKPFMANAESFENPDDKPVVSIVLIDDGSTPLSAGVLSSFPFPVSFAVDASKNNAGEMAAKYRAAGFEVLMMTNLPRGAQPADIEVAVEAYVANVPQAVAVLDAGENGFQDSRVLVDQVVEILASSGHGLLTQKQGLNTVSRAAEKADVPAATIFRDLDESGQDARVIARFLDQSAFRAGQTEDAIVILGRTRPDTIAALLTWGVGQRASRLAFAPISAAMK